MPSVRRAAVLPSCVQGAAEAGQARHRARPAQAGQLQVAGSRAAFGRRQPGGGERVLQDGEQRHRRQFLGHCTRQ